jgi:hypothetical protein
MRASNCQGTFAHILFHCHGNIQIFPVCPLQYPFTVSKDERLVWCRRVVKATRDVSVVGSRENFTIGYHIMKVGVVNECQCLSKGFQDPYHDGGCG